MNTRIDSIVSDPNHALPEGVRGIIKLAYIHDTTNGRTISGELWYDQDKIFPDGYMINTSLITNVEGDVYTLQSGRKYLVEVING